MSRPSGDVIIWASNGSILSGPAIGSPTKFRPDAGSIASGYVPGQPIAADFENFLWNDYGLRLDDLDLLRSSNWIEPAASATITGTASSGLAGAEFSYADPSWLPTETLYFRTPGTTVQKSVDGGYTWTNDLVASSHVLHAMGQNSYSNAVVGESAGVGRIYLQGSGGSWAGNPLTGNTTARCLRYDVTNDVWWCGGGGGTPTYAIRRVRAVGGVFGSAASVTSSGRNLVGTAPFLRSMAVGPAFGLAAYYNTVADQSYVVKWDVTGMTMVEVSSGLPTTKPIVDLHYVSADGVFLLFYDTGTDTTVYRSTNGNTWALVATLAAQRTGLNGGCVDGSVITLPVYNGSVRKIAISRDAGATWAFRADPLAAFGPPAVTGTSVTLRKVSGRLMLSGESNAAPGTFYWRASLRAGR